jgi:dCMP deaminase
MQRERASWDEYFMGIARQVATRSTCDRKHVGAVIVRDRMILATGYNGSIRGLPHCDDAGHMMEGGHCVRTVHAEANAIVQAARNGMRLEAGHIYVTASPCFACFKLIANSGLSRIVFGEFYRDERIFELSQALGIELVHLPIATVIAHQDRDLATDPLKPAAPGAAPHALAAEPGKESS